MQIPKEQIMPNPQFSVLMAEVLKKGKAFRFQASGSSMNPFIKDGDILTLVNVSQGEIKIGNVLSFIHPHNRKLMVHRVVNIKQKKYLMKPDHNANVDGWVNHQEIIGIVHSVERGESLIQFGNGWEKIWIAHLSRWNVLMPIIHLLWRFVPQKMKHRIKGK